MHRKGATPSTIATFLLTDEDSISSGMENKFALRIDMSFPEKIQALAIFVRRDIKTLSKRYHLAIDPTTREAALAEYVSRENAIYQNAWKDHDSAFDHKDKLAALKVAQSAAVNTARALGVVLTPLVNIEGGDANTIRELTIINNMSQMAVMTGGAETGGFPQPEQLEEGPLEEEEIIDHSPETPSKVEVLTGS